MPLFASSVRAMSAAAVILSFVAAGPKETADAAGLAFDFGRAIECRDVTTPEFSERYPDERVIESTIRLSVYLTSGAMSDVETIRVEIGDVDRRLKVYDFSPSTRLESEFADDIETVKTTESSHSFEASLGGEVPCIGGTAANVTPSISGGKGGKEVVTEKQKRVAPKQAVIASGTTNEEHGVFFVLRPSPTTSLEGVHELKVQFIVPVTWRGDAVRVAVQAAGNQKVLWMNQPKVLAQKSTAVALYMEGDFAARRAAERLVRQ
ncbi:hypothetical protein [Lacipirellula parvula]|uniref:Uncharacterized protein n=1 Tax=Lacipirellula parvula TaxID=2650471 RepID=A0A5K7XND2_9BACT|nr:hypothetical protein [Lacipirellula parvula]BBO36546.1 hypothetical protein PLANPX_6158 [Lacipirellula parvula]